MRNILIGLVAGVALALIISLFQGDVTVSKEAPPSSSVPAVASASKAPEKLPEARPKASAPVPAPKTVQSSPAPVAVASPTPPPGNGPMGNIPKVDEHTKQILERAQRKVAANQPEAAVEDLEAAYRTEPNNSNLAVELAIMQSDLMKNPRRSEEILTEYLKRDRDSGVVSAAYADFLTQNGRERDASQYFAKAAGSPNAPVEAQTQYGHHLMRLKDFEHAEVPYRTAYERSNGDLKMKTDSGESTLFAKERSGYTAIDYAHVLVRLGRLDEAAQLSQEAAVKLGRENAQVRILNNAIGKGRKGLAE